MGNEASSSSSSRANTAYTTGSKQEARLPAGPVIRREKDLYEGVGAFNSSDKLTMHNKSAVHKRFLQKYLRKSYLFEHMDQEEIDAVVDTMKKRSVLAGPRHPLLSQGDIGEEFFVVNEGSFRISKDGFDLGEYGEGHAFGELSLIHNTARDVTVVAAEPPASVWVIDRATFRRTIGLVHAEKRKKLIQWFTKVPMLSKLSSSETMALVDSVRMLNFSAGQRIVKKGDPCKTLFMVAEGKVQTMPMGEIFETGQYFGELSLLGGHREKYDVCAVMQSTLVALNVDTFESVLGPYTALLEEHYNTAVMAKVPSLSKLTTLELKRLNGVLVPARHAGGTVLVTEGDALNKLVFIVAGQAIMTGDNIAGEDTRENYEKLESPWDPDQRVLGPGDFFGGYALLTEETCAYNVEVPEGDAPVDVMTLSRSDATALLGPLHRLIASRESEAEYGGYSAATTAFAEALAMGTDQNDPTWSNSVQAAALTASHRAQKSSGEGAELRLDMPDSSLKRQHWTVRHRPDIAFEELRTVATICEGQFTSIRVVTRKDAVEPEASNHQHVYALKSFSRPSVAVMGVEELPMREKAALTAINHPFVLKLFNTYKNSKKLYLLMEFVPGGELYHRIHPPDGGPSKLDEQHSRFYAASVLIALGYMHSHEIIYRALKPENIWLDAKGYIRLVNLESAKYVTHGDFTHTLCGIPEYMCPEMILGRGHRTGADWWAFGCLLYEMLTSHTPFEDMPQRREDVVMKNIIRHNFVPPPGASAAAQDLIEKLLHPKASSRLGCQSDGSIDIQDHTWFNAKDQAMQPIDFVSISSCTTAAPFIPPTRPSRAGYEYTRHFPGATTPK